MFYYIDKIEQVKGQEGAINEYGSRAKENGTFSEVEAKYFTSLANVANDLDETPDRSAANKNHLYMDIKIVNSKGGIEEKKQLGTYVEE